MGYRTGLANGPGITHQAEAQGGGFLYWLRTMLIVRNVMSG